jgi:NMD protein affecting ribosome stability and mRNA decay
MTGRTTHLGKKDRPRGVTARSAGARKATKDAGVVKCADCGLVEHRGRWAKRAPVLAHMTSGLCPACQRIRDRYPAGTLRLPLELLSNRPSLRQRIRNVEVAERREHPLERLMGVEEADGHLVVTTTGVHLARRIAHELSKELHRKPSIRYADGERLVHVQWTARPLLER